MDKQFKEWWSKASQTLKCDTYDAYEIWQASKLIPDRNILVNKGDYVELVKTNRERQETIARLTEEVKILRERKKFYKNKCKASSTPEGYVVVPKEPTEEMVEAADNALINVDIGTIDVYKAMIEAVEKNDE